ncbi:PPC domain containing protein, partial [Trema orientale]
GSAIGTAGGSFTPHVMTVETGEDVVSRILSSQKGPRAVCILSATGVVSSVTIRHTSGGLFEILSLSGSFVFGALSGSHRKNGTLSVLLAKPDGGVFGGGVVGSLLAAGPIQLIVGSFKQDFGKQLKSRLSAEPSICASMLHSSELVRVPVLMAPSADGDDSCVTPTSALPESARGGGGSVIAPNQTINRTSLHSIGQNVLQASQVLADHRSSPENINFSHT